MKLPRILAEPLIQRLSLQFLALAVVPMLVFMVLPTIYILLNGAEPVAEALLLLGVTQTAVFFAVVLVGAVVTLQRLALPIQELVKGAVTVSEGDLSYRVPIHHSERELVQLSKMFNAMVAAVEAMHNDIESQRLALQAALDAREQEFALILNVASQVNRQTDIVQSVQHALDMARPMLGTDIISLILLDEHEQTSSVAISCGKCTEAALDHDAQHCRGLVMRALSRMQPNLIQRAIETQKFIRVLDTEGMEPSLEPSIKKALDELGIRKMLIRPLVPQNRVLGVLVLMRYQVQNVPTRAETLMQMLTENIAILIENWHLQNKARSLTILEERQRLAAELHDSVTQSLFTLSLTARGLKSSLGPLADKNQQALETLVGQTKVIQAEMRTLINELRPVELEPDDLESALQQHIQSLRIAANTQVEFHVSGSLDALPRLVRRHLNRIVQEALSNIARHAEAKHVAIRLDAGEQAATLVIQDDGKGFDISAEPLHQSGSLGLVSMRERAELLGGSLLIRSLPGAGTVVTARIPIYRDTEESNALGTAYSRYLSG